MKLIFESNLLVSFSNNQTQRHSKIHLGFKWLTSGNPKELLCAGGSIKHLMFDYSIEYQYQRPIL